jgi:hypothetical protein
MPPTPQADPFSQPPASPQTRFDAGAAGRKTKPAALPAPPQAAGADQKTKPLPRPAAYASPPLDLFQTFLCNSGAERENLSNLFDLWDSVPRYSVSRQAMAKMRTANGFLGLLKLEFNYKGRPLRATVQPARIEAADGTAQDYYPGANEELVEDALRKFAAGRGQGYHEQPGAGCGVVFTLYALRQELKRMGHTRSYREIVLSLNILARSAIEIRNGDGEKLRGFTVSNYFPRLSAVSRADLDSDPQAKWIVQFHPLVAQGVDTLTYRQFNYRQMMTLGTQLARWLHKQLALKFTFASVATTFEMRFSTVKRDSALLEGYARATHAVEALDAAFEELKAGGLLRDARKNLVLGVKGKIKDAVYTLSASPEFVAQMKAANKRRAGPE